MELLPFIYDRLPLIYVFLSGIGFSIQSLIVKLLRQGGIHSFECLLVRGLCQIIVTSVILYYDPDRQTGRAPSLFGDTNYVRFILFLRALSGSIGVAATFFSAELLPLGDSTVLVMLCSIISPVVSFFVLGESWRIVECMATVVSMFGAILVVKPPFLFGYSVEPNQHADNNTSLGIFCGLLAALSYGFAYVFVRMLGTVAKMPWANVVLVQALGQVVLAVPALFIQSEPVVLLMSGREYLLLLVLGLVGSVSQVIMTIGMQKEKSALATGMRMSDVLFGFIFQAAFTSDVVSVFSVFGAVLVSGSILMMIITKESENELLSVRTGFESTTQAPEFNIENLEVDDVISDSDLPDQPFWKKPVFKSMSMMVLSKSKSSKVEYTALSQASDDNDR